MDTKGWQKQTSQKSSQSSPRGKTQNDQDESSRLLGLRKPTTRQTLNFMFNPELGKSISPLAQTAGIFVRLLAGVFAMHKLFPKDHPAFQDNDVRLSLGDVLATAWHNLTWSKENIPQLVLFFAVIGLLVSSALALITSLLSFFVGSAHACLN